MNTDYQLYAIHAGRFYSALPIKHPNGDWIPSGGYRCRAALFQNAKGTWVLHKLALRTASRYLDIPWFGTKRAGYGLIENVRFVPELEIINFDGGEYGPCWTVVLAPGNEIATSERDRAGRLLPCQVWNCACHANHTGDHIAHSGHIIGGHKPSTLAERAEHGVLS